MAQTQAVCPRSLLHTSLPWHGERVSEEPRPAPRTDLQLGRCSSFSLLAKPLPTYECRLTRSAQFQGLWSWQ